MRTVTTTIYYFNELPTEKAKENARHWWRGLDEGYLSADEALESVQAFAKHFGAKIGTYCFSINRSSTRINVPDLTEENFLGIDAYITDRDYMPTGYYLDCDLWTTFYDNVREHGNALQAFREAIKTFADTVTKDFEYQTTDEFIDEMLIVNDYEFTEDGDRYR